MHSRNPYNNNPPNFYELSKLYPELLQNVVIQSSNGRGYFIDWTNSESQRLLTKVLLLHNFGLNINLPPNRLCPPIPNRINYLCWLSELFEFKINNYPYLTKEQFNSFPILDIGVGASCIYPLLGHKMFGWNFYGSDIDQDSLEWANNQIILNNLENSIKLSKVESSNRLQLVLKEIISTRNEFNNNEDNDNDNNNNCNEDNDNMSINNLNQVKQNSVEHTKNLIQRIFQIFENDLSSFRGPIRQFLISLGGIHANTVIECESQRNILSPNNESIILAGCMCNPPFYTQEDEIGVNPKTICLGTQNEMITEGGEICFILGILIDSLILKTRIGWYTSMIGKKSSLRILLRFLRGVGVSHIFSTRFLQGKKGKSTVRWGVAWTFLDIYVPPTVEFNMTHKVFGQKKLRKRREASTQIQIIPITSFLSTIDPIEILYMRNYSQIYEINQITHTIVPINLVNFIKLHPISHKNIESSQLNSSKTLSCTCHNCILTYSFLRILNSLGNNSLFSFHNIEVRRERKSNQNETHFIWEVYFNIHLDDNHSIATDNSSTLDLIKLCIKLSAIVKDVNIENDQNRKRSNRDDSEYIEPFKKRTKIINDNNNNNNNNNDDDDNEQEEEDDDDEDNDSSGEESDNENVLIDATNTSNIVEEWTFEEEKSHVNFIQFSIFLATNLNQDNTNFLSPNLRKIFFNISEQIELDFLRTNRRWRRYLNS